MNNKSFRKNIFTFLSLFLFSLLCVCFYVIIAYNSINSESRKHSEIAIRAIVYDKTGKIPDELTDEDFAKFTKLNLEGIVPSDSKEKHEKIVASLANDPRDEGLRLLFLSYRISDLKLIEKFTNLEELNLIRLPFPENDIPKWMNLIAKLGIIDSSKRNELDLTPLTKLKYLKSIRISSSKFKSLKPLAKMKSLQSLGLNEIPHDKIQYISKLTNLQGIDFTKTGITDLELIKGLTQLKSIGIDQEPVNDLSPLKELTNLQKLALQYCKVSDLEPLRNLVNLDLIFLSNCNNISSLEPLKELKNLKELFIIQCPNITDEQKEDLRKALPGAKIY